MMETIPNNNNTIKKQVSNQGLKTNIIRDKQLKKASFATTIQDIKETKDYPNTLNYEYKLQDNQPTMLEASQFYIF